MLRYTTDRARPG